MNTAYSQELQSHSHHPKIYNHAVYPHPGATSDGLWASDFAAGQALGLTSPQDTIHLPPPLRPEWPVIVDHYKKIGLPHTHHVFWTTKLTDMEKYALKDVSITHFNRQRLTETSPPTWSESVKFISIKNNVVQLAQMLQIPIPTTLCFVNKSYVRHLDRMPYPCVVKTAADTPKSGDTVCSSPREILAILDRTEDNTPIQIQQRLPSLLNLSLQYEVYDGRLTQLDAIEQTDFASSSRGGRYPSRYTPWEYVEPMAQWLTDKGMEGVFSFDVSVSGSTIKPSFFMTDCNPGFNHLSYPAIIAKKLGIAHWISIQLKTRARSLRSVDLQDLEYNRKTGIGIVLVDWGNILNGEISLLIAGKPNTQQELLTATKARL